MKFLVDAQLPKRLAVWLTDSGHDAIHTLELPGGNETPDDEICRVAGEEKRIVVTKDDDFVYSFFVQARPDRLLLVSTGNIANNDLLNLFQERLRDILIAFSEYDFVELTSDSILLHE